MPILLMLLICDTILHKMTLIEAVMKKDDQLEADTQLFPETSTSECVDHLLTDSFDYMFFFLFTHTSTHKVNKYK